MASLTAGITEKSSAATADSTNPPFHPNILKIYSQNDENKNWEPINLYRGLIVAVSSSDGSSGSTPQPANPTATAATAAAPDTTSTAGKGVKFLYNPSQIKLDHNINQDQPPPGLPGGASDTANSNPAVDSGTLSFSLLFDRTYEVWQNKNHAGVLVDVRAFYAMTGMLSDGADVDPDDLKSMSPVPAYVYFGQNGPKQDKKTTKPLAYHGWINALSITYTHWSVNMIPMRCAIDVNFRLWPAGSSDAGGGAAPTPGGATTPPAPGAPPAPDPAGSAAPSGGSLGDNIK